jgi:hypothetical protein
MAEESNKEILKGDIFYKDSAKKMIVRLISLDTLKSIKPDVAGGHISIYPWYDAYITKKNGSTAASRVFKLCVSNHMYLSGFGGGFKKTKSPYKGLEKELKEEVPDWKDYLTTHMATDPLLIFMVEHYPNSHMRISEINKIECIIFLHVPSDTFNALPLTVTKEVRGFLDMEVDKFHKIVDNEEGIASSGIHIYHMIRKKMKNTKEMNRILVDHFKMNKPMITLTESDMDFSNVMVELSNSYKRSFNTLVKDDKLWNPDLDKAWPYREKYGKIMMSQKGPSDLPHKNQKKNKSIKQHHNDHLDEKEMEEKQELNEQHHQDIIHPKNNINNNGFRIVHKQKGKNKTLKNKKNKNK